MLSKFCPERLEYYVEPFLGSGALFFHLVQSRPRFSALLSDSNSELINVYLQVRDRTSELVEVLEDHQQKYYAGRERYYYSVRESEPVGRVDRAARMIFLNRTCYNGLFRVNRAGRFNVPHGTYEHPTVCNREALFSAAKVLSLDGVSIECADYILSTRSCAKGDMVYFDPPYLPVSKTANFVDYTRESFGWQDHLTLAREFVRLHDVGCTVILSNSDTDRIRTLYSDFAIKTTRVGRMINCNASRRMGQSELVISNSSLAKRVRPPRIATAVQAINF
jgi:DNA adenine methylase